MSETTTRTVLYAVTAQAIKTWEDGSITPTQVPTFYLAEGVQGILNTEHAQSIAEGVINPLQDSSIKVVSHIVRVEV